MHEASTSDFRRAENIRESPPPQAGVDRSELLRALQHGMKAADQLAASARGPFAVWAKDDVNGRSFGAVDRFAAMQLCWRSDLGGPRFAESALELARTDSELDPQAVFDYLYFHCIPSPRTVFRDVHRVPAAHRIAANGDDVVLAPYWTPRFPASTNPGAFAHLRDTFRQLLRDAVRRQLRDGPPACFLSGGTDSSTVAGVIREVTGQAPMTYSIGFDAAGYDEMEYARLAAKRFGCVHHEYYVTPDDLVRNIPIVASSFDQPFGNSSVLPAYCCALQAKDDGIGRLLAGDGGDELFGGNSRYAKQRLFGLYDRVPGGLRKYLFDPLASSRFAGRVPAMNKVASYVEQARVPMPDRLQMYNLLLRLGIDNVLTPGFLAQVDTQEPTKHQRDVWDWAGSASELNRTLAFDWRYTLGETDLPKVRGAAKLAGVTVGFPMLDEDLLEFSMSLPDSYKLRGLRLRWFFKEALRGFLPDEIIRKSKHGFGLPFGPWLLQHGPLHKLAADSLSSLGERGMIRPKFLKDLLQDRLAEHPGYFGEMIWILMMLEQWLLHHRPAARFGG